MIVVDFLLEIKDQRLVIKDHLLTIGDENGIVDKGDDLGEKSFVDRLGHCISSVLGLRRRMQLRDDVTSCSDRL